MAGMRIGFCIGNEMLIHYLNDVKFSFNSYTMNLPSQVMIRTVGHSFIADDSHKSCRTLDQKRSKQNLQKRSRTHRQKQ